MKRVLVIVLSCLWLSAFACAADSSDFLPKSFAGWTQVGSPRATSNPAQADGAYPAVLKEYGFRDSDSATYTRDDGTKLTIKAAQFADATGAYGAFTFYRQPSMKTEEIGTKAASENNRILFFRSNVLVDANFDRVTEMSAAQLRELASMLPAVQGSAGNLPSLPDYLPKKDAVANTAKYVLGPQALLASKSPLTPEQIDFSREPEVISQDYTSPDGPLTLTVINYPTPQIAGERLRALQGQQVNGSSMLVRRTGPLLDIVTGATGSSNARTLLQSVNYEAEVTWDEATSVAPRNNIGNLIVAVFALIGIILLISFVFGIFFGGLRIVTKRLFPDRVFDRPENMEIIQLHLEEPTKR
ncbi:MAG TPA: DUF6599 family protein [Alloacidobacterium sp.]|nr:DUF6599 family protein [Alloacidobacterium sp.]